MLTVLFILLFVFLTVGGVASYYAFGRNNTVVKELEDKVKQVEQKVKDEVQKL